MAEKLETLKKALKQEELRYEEASAKQEKLQERIRIAGEKLTQVRKEVFTEKIVYKYEHEELEAQKKRKEQRNAELRQMLSEGIFGEKHTIIPTKEHELREELSAGPKNARDKLRRKTWSSQLRSRIAEEHEAGIMQAEKKKHYDEVYSQNISSLQERLAKTDGRKTSDFSELMESQLLESDFWKKYGDYGTEGAEGAEVTQGTDAADRAFAADTALLRELLAVKDKTASSEILPFLERYRKLHRCAEGDLSVEYLECDTLAVPEATYSFLINAAIKDMAEHISARGEKASCGISFSDGDIAGLEALVAGSEAVTDSLYVSEGYRSATVERKLGELEKNSAESESYEADERIAAASKEKSALLEEQKRLEEESARIEKEKKRLEGELAREIKESGEQISMIRNVLLSLYKGKADGLLFGYIPLIRELMSREIRAGEEQTKKLLRSFETVAAKSEAEAQSFFRKKSGKEHSDAEAGIFAAFCRKKITENAMKGVLREAMKDAVKDTAAKKSVLTEEDLESLWKKFTMRAEKQRKQTELAQKRQERLTEAEDYISQRIRSGRNAAKRLEDEKTDRAVKRKIMTGCSPVMAKEKKAPPPSKWQAYSIIVDRYMEQHDISEDSWLRGIFTDVLASEKGLQGEDREAAIVSRFAAIEAVKKGIEKRLAGQNEGTFADESLVRGALTYYISRHERWGEHASQKSLEDYKRNLAACVSFRELEKQCADPVLSSVFEESARTLEYVKFTSSPDDFEALAKERTRYLRRRAEASAAFEKLIKEASDKSGAEGKAALTKEQMLIVRANLLDIFEEDIYGEAEVSTAAAEVASLLAKPLYIKALAKASAGSEGIGVDVWDTFEIQRRGHKTSSRFREFLAETASKEQRAVIDSYDANQLGIFASVLAMPELLSWTAKSAGLGMLEEGPAFIKRLSDVQKALNDYRNDEKSDIFAEFRPDFDGAEMMLLKETGESGQAALDDEKFRYAAGFVTICTRMRERSRASRAEKAVKGDAKQKALMAERQKQHDAELEKIRAAASPSGILASKNEKAAELLGRMQRGELKRPENAGELFDILWQQAEDELQRSIIAGFMALGEEQRQLAVSALSKRDVLDISKKNIGLNRMGKAERDYVNPEGRYALVDRYLAGGFSEKLSADDYGSAFYGLLSSQTDDRNFDRFSRRSGAIDWKLLRRAVQLAVRTENEKHLFEAQKRIFGEDKLRAEALSFETDAAMLRKNRHSAGTRFTRFVIRKTVDAVSDSVPDIAGEAAAFVFSEDVWKAGAAFAQKVRAQKPVEAALSLSDAHGEVSDAFGILENVKEVAKGAAAITGNLEARKEAGDESRYLWENREHLRVAAFEERKENEKNLFMGVTFSNERAGDEIQDALAGAARYVYGKALAEDKIGPVVMEAVNGLIKFIRSYVSDVSCIGKFFDIDKEIESCNAATASKGEGAVLESGASMLRKLQFVTAAKGFENMTEISDMIGINICHSILFTASRFFNGQSKVRELAVRLLASLNHTELIDDVSADAAAVLFGAVMGDSR
ncbi:MAG: hypothetical protein K6F52_06345 [Clostridia bacterium]|nr:hypothetical protein [Clostridia bacterium]